MLIADFQDVVDRNSDAMQGSMVAVAALQYAFWTVELQSFAAFLRLRH